MDITTILSGNTGLCMILISDQFLVIFWILLRSVVKNVMREIFTRKVNNSIVKEKENLFLVGVHLIKKFVGKLKYGS